VSELTGVQKFTLVSVMSFSIEDDDLDYSPTPLPPTIDDPRIVINAFPDDHFVPESSSLLGDRVIGTLGFCGALALLSSTCCCFCRGCHRTELANTYNKFTVFGMCCPFG
jgi:hypothetical protein